jgi:hypothetical protein
LLGKTQLALRRETVLFDSFAIMFENKLEQLEKRGGTMRLDQNIL